MVHLIPELRTERQGEQTILGFFGIVYNVASNGGKGALRIAYGSRGPIGIKSGDGNER